MSLRTRDFFELTEVTGMGYRVANRGKWTYRVYQHTDGTMSLQILECKGGDKIAEIPKKTPDAEIQEAVSSNSGKSKRKP